MKGALMHLLPMVLLVTAGPPDPVGTGSRDEMPPGEASVARTPPSDRVEWVWIEGGRYPMGSEEGESDERPVHEVELRGFWMARTEVTVAQYRRCVEAGACTAPGMGETCNWGVRGREAHPVNCVGWTQAAAFSTWAGGRLPSEAEWEYAARGEGRAQRYPWGDATATCEHTVMSENRDGCGKRSTWAVCSKPTGNTPQGLCDMSGNVWEWVQDRYHPSYEGAPTDGQAWEEGGSNRVLRGGSWTLNSKRVRAAHRVWDVPSGAGDYVGFRPASSE